jgi:hypothetical protein
MLFWNDCQSRDRYLFNADLKIANIANVNISIEFDFDMSFRAVQFAEVRVLWLHNPSGDRS